MTHWMSRIKAALLIVAAVALVGCAERVTREEFSSTVMYKSTSEVAKRFGKPKEVEEEPGTIRWIYTSKTFNVADGTWTIDPKTVVVFNQPNPDADPTVHEVLYESSPKAKQREAERTQGGSASTES